MPALWYIFCQDVFNQLYIYEVKFMFYIFFLQVVTAFDCSDMFLSGPLSSWQKAENGSNKSHQCSIQILIILIIDFSNVSLPYTLWLHNILDTETVQWSVLMFWSLISMRGLSWGKLHVYCSWWKVKWKSMYIKIWEVKPSIFVTFFHLATHLTLIL